MNLEEINKDNSRYAVTIARSLGPKVLSLVDIFNENDLSFAVIGKTWFKKSNKLEETIIDLEHGHDLKSISCNRKKINYRTKRPAVGGGESL